MLQVSVDTARSRRGRFVETCQREDESAARRIDAFPEAKRLAIPKLTCT